MHPVLLSCKSESWGPEHDLRLLLHPHCLPGVLYPCVTARENLKGLSLPDCNNDVGQQKEKECFGLRSQQEGSQNNSPIDQGLRGGVGKESFDCPWRGLYTTSLA